MTIYYVKQDNTVWGCGDPGCCGPYYEEIDNIFHECDCKDVEVDADHLQGCVGGGPILKWREASKIETLAFKSGSDDGYNKGHWDGAEYQKKQDARKAKYADEAKTEAQRSIHELVHLGYKVTVDGTKIGKSINHYTEYSEDVILETPYFFDATEGFSLQIKHEDEGTFGSIRSEYYLVVGEEEVAIPPTIAYGITKAMDAFRQKYGRNNETLF